MNFFNFSSLFYNFRKICKYLMFSLLLVVFIILCLLLMQNTVKAADEIVLPPVGPVLQGNNYWFILDIPYTSGTFINTGYYLFTLPTENFSYSGNYNSSDPDLYNSGYNVSGTINIYYYDGSSWSYVRNYNGPTSFIFRRPLEDLLCASNFEIKWGTLNEIPLDLRGTVLFGPSDNNVVFFDEPIFNNYENSNWGNTLFNGEFTYFDFVGFSDHDIIIYFYDITDIDNSVLLSDGSLSGVFSWSCNLRQVDNYGNMPFCYLNNDDGSYYYAFPCNLPFGTYQSGHTYKLVMDYHISGSVWGSKDFTWTTSFSQAGVTKQDQNNSDALLQNFNNLNEYINQSFNDGTNILTGLPTSIINDNPTGLYFDRIFTNVYNNFISDDYPQSVTFTLPFVDYDLTIYVDDLTGNLPAEILIFIRSFYWFAISLFIFKKIYSLFELFASGDILSSSNSGIKNIKTQIF